MVQGIGSLITCSHPMVLRLEWSPHDNGKYFQIEYHTNLPSTVIALTVFFLKKSLNSLWLLFHCLHLIFEGVLQLCRKQLEGRVAA